MWNPFKKRTFEVSTKDGESITSDEGAYIAKAVGTDTPSCPDCRIGNLCKGPEGGASMNCMCNHCTSEFNLVLGPTWTIGERISDPGQGDHDRARTLYGINP